MSESTRSVAAFVRFWTALMVMGAAMLPRASTSKPPSLSVESLLNAYDRAEYSRVEQQLEAVDNPRVLDRLDSELKDRAKAWIESVTTAERRRRAFVAGALALEVTHALVAKQSWNTDLDHATNPEALPKVNRLIADQSNRPDAIEHAWMLGQLATWQEWNVVARMVAGDAWVTPEPVWAVLMGKPPLIQLSKTQSAFGSRGYLGEALARFPGDQRLLLALAEARESIETRCPIDYCHDEMTPAALSDLNRRAKVAPPERGPWDRHLRSIHEMAVANLAAFKRLLPVGAEFAALATDHPEIRAEANVHIGYLAIRAARPDAALAPLAAALNSDDPYVRYLAEYFSGRALEALGRNPEAVAAYRRALAVVPNAPSAAALLAAQLLMSDDGVEREEAFRVLQAATTPGPRPVDPWDLYWYGDARLRPVYIERLRQALRQ